MRLQLAYFDTSAWNNLADHPGSEAIVAELQHRRVLVLASVISVGEVLRTPAPDRLERLRCLVLKLHGDRVLLERPMTLAAEAARAFLHSEKDFLLPQSGPARSLLECLHRPDDAHSPVIAAWLQDLERNHEKFHAEVKPERPTRDTPY